MEDSLASQVRRALAPAREENINPCVGAVPTTVRFFIFFVTKTYFSVLFVIPLPHRFRHLHRHRLEDHNDVHAFQLVAYGANSGGRSRVPRKRGAVGCPRQAGSGSAASTASVWVTSEERSVLLLGHCGGSRQRFRGAG